MKIHITPLMAIESLRQVVAKRGRDYVDPGAVNGQCVYMNADGQPSCGVGTALIEGLNVPLIKNYEGAALSLLGTLHAVNQPGDSYDDRYTYASQDLEEFDSDEGAADIYALFQQLQDSGKTWGEALDQAEAYYRVFQGQGRVAAMNATKLDHYA
jgi:hypothetical protein